MIRKKTLIFGHTISQWLLFIVMLAICIFLISPIIWLFSASLQDNAAIYQSNFAWIPKEFHWSNYAQAWNEAGIGRAFLNTVFVSAIMLIFHLFLCTFAGYVLGKYQFKHRALIITLITMTMMLPQEVTYFPVYSMMRELGLLNSYFGLAMPFFVSGMGVFLMMQFSQYVPTEIMEAARIDGCDEFTIFFKVALPLMLPSISALGILAFTFIWNEYAWARLAASSTDMNTLSITLSMIANNSDSTIQDVVLLAGGVITILPIMILFICFSKNFIESVTKSGLKG